MKRITSTLVFLISLFFFQNGFSQDINISDEIKKVLTNSELSNYNKGIKSIEKADLLAPVSTGKHQLAEKARKEAKKKKRRKRRKALKKAKKYDKEALKSYLPAAKLYRKGGKYIYSALLKTLAVLAHKAEPEQKDILLDFKNDYVSFYKMSEQKWKLALKEKSTLKKYKLLIESNQILRQAYEHQSLALTDYYGWLKPKEAPVVDAVEEQDTTLNPDNSASSNETFEIYKKDSVIKTNDAILFKIQIAASYKPLPVSSLKRIYSGDVVFNNEKSGQWYRYLINEYPTYAQAVAAKRRMGINGSFVVAYRDGIRIKNIQEVAKPLDDYPASSQMGNTNSGIEYRLQIGTSTLPTSPKDIAKLNSTSEPVKTYKSRVLYKYTIGSFSSEQEAIEYKQSNNLYKYIIVRYKDGKEFR